jgi:hypothetical protein
MKKCIFISLASTSDYESNPGCGTRVRYPAGFTFFFLFCLAPFTMYQTPVIDHCPWPSWHCSPSSTPPSHQRTIVAARLVGNTYISGHRDTAEINVAKMALNHREIDNIIKDYCKCTSESFQWYGSGYLYHTDINVIILKSHWHSDIVLRMSPTIMPSGACAFVRINQPIITMVSVCHVPSLLFLVPFYCLSRPV